MRTFINPKWIETMNQKINNKELIDVTTGSNKCAQWLIIRLELAGYAYKVKHCGAGVKRITGEKT